jgi:hypothetical protein
VGVVAAFVMDLKGGFAGGMAAACGAFSQNGGPITVPKVAIRLAWAVKGPPIEHQEAQDHQEQGEGANIMRGPGRRWRLAGPANAFPQSLLSNRDPRWHCLCCPRGFASKVFRLGAAFQPVLGHSRSRVINH